MVKLGVYLPDEAAEATAPAPRTTALSARMKLSQFFENWFLPIVLVAEREARETTIVNYRESLVWWRKLTHDPALEAIDEFTLALFQEGLRKATFRRSPAGAETVLSEHTQHKHLRNIRALLYRTGPTLSVRRPAKQLVAKTPLLRLPPTPVQEIKACFTLPECLQIVAAAEQMRAPDVPHVSPRDWWRAWLALHFYTGQRTGTVAELTWGHVREAGGQHWIDVPSEAVGKTSKETTVVIHARLWEALTAIRRGAEPGEPLIVLPNHRWIAELHERLQVLAGIPADKTLSPHAWRRTHSNQLAQLGLDAVAGLCRQSLGHSDTQTTTQHYVSLPNKFRAMLPDLWG